MVKLPTFGLDKTLCLSAAGVLELLMEDALDFDGKKLTVKSPLPEEKAYLRPVYQVVEKKQPVKFESVVEYFSLAFTDKHMNELIDSIGAALCAKRLRAKRRKGRTFWREGSLYSKRGRCRCCCTEYPCRTA